MALNLLPEADPWKAVPAGCKPRVRTCKAGPRKSGAYSAVSRSSALLSSWTGNRRLNPFHYPLVETQLKVLYAGHDSKKRYVLSWPA